MNDIILSAPDDQKVRSKNSDCSVYHDAFYMAESLHILALLLLQLVRRYIVYYACYSLNVITHLPLFLYFVGENQEAGGYLGERCHFPTSHAHTIQRKTERPIANPK